MEARETNSKQQNIGLDEGKVNMESTKLFSNE